MEGTCIQLKSYPLFRFMHQFSKWWIFLKFWCTKGMCGRNIKGGHACKFNKQILINIQPIDVEIETSFYTSNFIFS